MARWRAPARHNPAIFPSRDTFGRQGHSGKERNDGTGVDTTTYQDSRRPGRVMARNRQTPWHVCMPTSPSSGVGFAQNWRSGWAYAQLLYAAVLTNGSWASLTNSSDGSCSSSCALRTVPVPYLRPSWQLGNGTAVSVATPSPMPSSTGAQRGMDRRWRVQREATVRAVFESWPQGGSGLGMVRHWSSSTITVVLKGNISSLENYKYLRGWLPLSVA